MDVKIKRIARKSSYTIGRLYVNGVRVCDTLEDADLLYFGKAKVKGKTAIPCGRYALLLNVYSPRFGGLEPYKSINNGCVPFVSNVPGFEGVRIHIGNTPGDTDGCPLVGENKQVGKVLNSRATYERLMKQFLIPARERKEKVWITIV